MMSDTTATEIFMKESELLNNEQLLKQNGELFVENLRLKKQLDDIQKPKQELENKLDKMLAGIKSDAAFEIFEHAAFPGRMLFKISWAEENIKRQMF